METRTCENCGLEFRGAAQARFHNDACRKAFRRAAAKNRDVDPTLPEIDVSEPEPEGERPIGVLLALDPYVPLTDLEEDLVRRHFGYASSEKRTRAERQRVAERAMKGRPRIRLEIERVNDLAVAARPDFGKLLEGRS